MTNALKYRLLPAFCSYLRRTSTRGFVIHSSFGLRHSSFQPLLALLAYAAQLV
jgi:hypothetical protein